MTQTDDLIKKFTKERPGLDKKIAHYDEQFDYAIAIIKLRKKLNLTQQQLADKIGVSQPMIARWESGSGNITMKNMERIAQATSKKLIIAFA
ncbi:helix-turn-helix domain-containing protein [Lentilactobacillus kisonensis]|nr:helix-turn-helix transcriptional regulator [Lentilactobacillus kisonensis]